jgi:hypothetical protein
MKWHYFNHSWGVKDSPGVHSLFFGGENQQILEKIYKEFFLSNFDLDFNLVVSNLIFFSPFGQVLEVYFHSMLNPSWRKLMQHQEIVIEKTLVNATNSQEKKNSL